MGRSRGAPLFPQGKRIDRYPPIMIHGAQRSPSMLSSRYSAGLLGVLSLVASLWAEAPSNPKGLQLNAKEYLEMPGLNVMLAQDYYPDGHQGGVGILLNGLRVATNGDLRLEPTPGQWSPIPATGKRAVDRAKSEISVRLSYPDPTKDRKGFNPIEYPDLKMAYTVRVRPEGKAFRVTVDLDQPLSPEWERKVGFNLELFPGLLFGHSWDLGGRSGLFPQQPEGPGILDKEGEYQVLPLASGRRFEMGAETRDRHLVIECVSGGDLALLDGRGRHNNGWFVLRSLVQPGRTTGAIEWLVTPDPLEGWLSQPVIQVSQLGYHPAQPKTVLLELDPADQAGGELALHRVSGGQGRQEVLRSVPTLRGDFLRYRYLGLDFSQVREPGVYVFTYRGRDSHPFRIDERVYAQGAWQPTVQCFLPVQMCHMRVNDRYRVWHGLCHEDDALMAPVNLNHFDGYAQGPSTLCRFGDLEHVPGLAVGGWHDAGDYDLRIESQVGTVHFLALAYEAFGCRDDNTSIDEQARVAELNRPDGKPDVLQQVEHGLLSILGGYKSLGRLYRGIQDSNLRQYTHLGDAQTMTDGRVTAAGMKGDDRMVFTEKNALHELQAVAGLAACSRVLRGYNDPLARESLDTALALWTATPGGPAAARAEAALELHLSTGNPEYLQLFVTKVDELCAQIRHSDWILARSLAVVKDEGYRGKVLASLRALRGSQAAQAALTPYGIPYEPDIWGAGWQIQHHGVSQFFLHQALPDLFPADAVYASLNFVLGLHPGSNTSAFVTGLGATTMPMAYGNNRADNSGIPGGVISGTALIRPDFPELLEWPYLWQQTEYCLGTSTSEYVFLVQAVDSLLKKQHSGTP